jgi:hypothetical protein
MPAPLLYAALTAAAPVICANPDPAVALLAGVFLAAPPHAHIAAATFLDLPADTPNVAATALADHIAGVLCASTNPEDADQVAAQLRATCRAKNIALRTSHTAPERLIPAWTLAVLTAGTNRASDLRRYLHAAIHRDVWQARSPLPELADVFDTLTHATASTPRGPQASGGYGTPDPASTQLPASTLPRLTPQLTSTEAADLELTLTELARHFDATTDDLTIWRRNARIRGMLISQYITANGGLTPAEVVQLQHPGR